MKFNEKLIDLRKKAGLSQEELGYKLNVTRQTVSKWELGQTTPEMDKLIEIGKIFNVTVDELVNESEVKTNVNPIIEDQAIKSEKPKDNKWIIIIVVALIAIIIYLIVKLVPSFFAFDIFNNATDKIMDGISEINKESTDEVLDLFDKVTEYQEDVVENSDEIVEDIKDKVENSNEIIEDMQEQAEDLNNTANISKFNATLELYNGSNSGMQLKRLLEEVITKNKKEDRKITVKYSGTELQDVGEIQNLKLNIKDLNIFEVTLEYNQEGYIYQVKIQKIVSEFEVQSFNNSFELYAGSSNGMFVTKALDAIISSNKTEEQKITVKYNEIETQDENEIKNIKSNFGTFDKCEITYKYDSDGFINKAIIEKL